MAALAVSSIGPIIQDRRKRKQLVAFKIYMYRKRPVTSPVRRIARRDDHRLEGVATSFAFGGPLLEPLLHLVPRRLVVHIDRRDDADPLCRDAEAGLHTSAPPPAPPTHELEHRRVLRVRHAVGLAALGTVALWVEHGGRVVATLGAGDDLGRARILVVRPARGLERPAGRTQADDLREGILAVRTLALERVEVVGQRLLRAARSASHRQQDTHMPKRLVTWT